MTAGTSPLAEAAERFDRLARSLKAAQFAATGAVPVTEEAVVGLHPDEAWARRFAARVIGRGPAPLPAVRPAPAVEIPPAGPPRGGHIGSGLGKPGPRRSWVARLFRGG